MSWLFILFGVFIGFCGLVMLFQGINRRLHWPETKGEVIDFKEKIDDTDNGKQITYIPQIKFTVKGKEYTAYADENMTWHKKKVSKRIAVLYDRDNPERIYLKDYTVLFGCVILIVGALFLALGISFLNK